MSDARPAPGTATVWWLGQGSFVFEGPASGPLVVDPYLSNSCENNGRAKRMHPIPIAAGDLKAAALFLTHDHRDHTDPETLPALVAANPETPIFAPPASVAHLARLGIAGPTIHPLERGQTVTGPGWTAHAVFAKHTEDSVGLVIIFDAGPTVYHTADTEYFEEIGDAARFQPDLLTICINGRLGNMGIADAVRATGAIAPVQVMPMHWGLFPENTADPKAFVTALAEAKVPAQPIVLTPGLGRHTVFARRGAA